MANILKPKISLSEEILSTTTYDREFVGNNLNNSYQTPYEVFRNKTTAVEVIIKEVRHKGKTKITANQNRTNAKATNNKLNEDLQKLKSELHKVNLNLDEAQKRFKAILCEMKKQLEEANQRELKTQTKNLALQLEKEKLRTLLESKSNLVTKLKKELLGMRRILKVVLKSIRITPTSHDTVYLSDVEYEEFERELKDSSYMPEISIKNENILGKLMSNEI